jgi:mitogen-activated protein kinase 1/3
LIEVDEDGRRDSEPEVNIVNECDVEGVRNFTVVAIKKVSSVFETDEQAHRLLREIKLLRLMRGHPNICKLQGIMRPRDAKSFKSLNLVTEYCSQNMKNVIRYNASKLTDKHIKYFIYELMKGVLFMHSKGIIHRDLKPLNILVTDQWEVKISDFGQSNVRVGRINAEYKLTKGVATRQYRAPELFLCYNANYSAAVDLWSVGCILAEFYLKDVFMNAKSTEGYLKSLLEILGMPSASM